ncbi:hypothetical protein [Micromonospora endolithica]|uniref:Uncharacterized protein n=1 Tax=Micromonospora endolithica TaxID=230091 RepID=A0A3A9ZQE3_9ACTN|nr:hypothetical protein [Micromonospora endolithica]RKN50405.1 hypothetical protein D7223_00965 [Micromonospora endolithica]TWJ20915.1 hypothetical protein JD76_01015 [Micromonospora endolithica]
MGMTDAIARSAVRHAHVLVVEVPGHWLTRVAVERHVSARCWRLATSPADADVLAVCGTPGPELTQLVTRLWVQMPGPRSRIQVGSLDAVVPALAAAEDELLDWARQRADSRDRPDAHPRGSRQDETSTTNHAAAASGHGEPGPHAGHDAAESAFLRNHGQHLGHDQLGGMRHGRHAGHDPMSGKDVAGRGGTDPATQTGHDMHGGLGHGGHTGDGAMEHGDMDHAGESHADMGHEGMGHGDMEMAPAGIPLARGGEDRDGLELDVLHVQLGPVLAYWPAGLVLRCTLQGDVIVDAEARLIDADVDSTAHDRVLFDQLRWAARRCDNALNLLALAGWTDAASRARRIRDALLSDAHVDRAAADVDRLCRSVRRSWLLRWSLRRLRYLSDDDLDRHGLPAHLGGDTRDRVLSMLQQAGTILAGTAGEPGTGHTSPTPVGRIPELVRGLDLAAARLVVASLDLDALSSAHGEVSRV